MIPPQYRFHGPSDNTSHYLGPHCNKNSCGAPDPFEGDEIPFDWEGEKKDDLGVDNCGPLK
jgi:hypothetical protein